MIVPLRRCYIKLLQIQRILADIDILLSDVAGSAVNRTISIIPRSGVIRTCTGPFQTVLDSIGTAVGSNVVEVVNAFITSHITGYRTGHHRRADDNLLLHTGCQMIWTHPRCRCCFHKCFGIFNGNILSSVVCVRKVCIIHRRIPQNIFYSGLRLYITSVLQRFKLEDATLI